MQRKSESIRASAARLSLGASMAAALFSPGTALAQIDEVVVYAQKRAEAVQDVPVAVSVVTGEAFESQGLVDVSGLTQVVPSVTYQTGSEERNQSFRVRGIGTDVFALGVEPSVSTVIDGVVYARPGAAFTDLTDIARIEVLRGPQGTLFGKNSSAGVVSIVTKEPSFEEAETKAAFTIAEDNERRAQVSVSAPLGEDLAFRLSAFARKQDGIIRNLYDGDTVNDVEAAGVRAKLKWLASESLSFTLIADVSYSDTTCCAAPIRVNAVNPIQLPTRTRIGPDNDQVNNDLDTFTTNDAWGLSVQTDWDLGGGYSLTNILAHRSWISRGEPRDLDNTAARQVFTNSGGESSHALSNELRLTSPQEGFFDYVAGVFVYQHDSRRTNSNSGYRRVDVQSSGVINPDGSITIAPSFLRSANLDTSVDSVNYAAFGQLNMHPTEKLTAFVGARYIHETQDWDFVRRGTTLAGRPPLGPLSRSFEDSAVTGKAGVRYEWTPDVMTYVSYGTGYKGQAINAVLNLQASEVPLQPLDPETSEMWEIGLKSTLLDRRLQFNVTGFMQRLEDYQAQALDPIIGGNTLTNAGTAAIDGVEVEFTARPFDRVSLSGGATFLDATFDSFRNAPCFAGQTAGQGCIGGFQDVSGKAFPNAPDLRVTFSADYEHPVTSRGDYLYVQYNYRWQDEVQFDITQDPNTIQGAYGISDLALGFGSSNDSLRAELFVKNLGDKHYASNIEAWPAVHAGNGGYLQMLPRDFGRYFGVRLVIQP